MRNVSHPFRMGRGAAGFYEPGTPVDFLPGTGMNGI